MHIRDLLHPGVMVLNLQARSPQAAMRELGEKLAQDGAVTDLDLYLEAVQARETQGTTAVGFGVAIPHGKSRGAARAAVAFGRSQAGIEWESLDGKPVHMVFLIAAPEAADNLHLKVLSQLARTLMHEEVRNQLLTAQDPSAVMKTLEAAIS